MASFLRDMVKISLQEQSIHKYLQYSTTKLETCAPITLCALRVHRLQGQLPFLNSLYKIDFRCANVKHFTINTKRDYLS